MFKHRFRMILCPIVLSLVTINCGPPEAPHAPHTPGVGTESPRVHRCGPPAGLRMSGGQQVNLVLSRIERFRAPPYPPSRYVTMETYDYRVRSGAVNPPTLTDTFIADIWQLLTRRLRPRIVSPTCVSIADVTRVMAIYLSQSWRQIPGYRPWTHWSFVRSLQPHERQALIKEVVAYIYRRGVWNKQLGFVR